MLPQGDYEHLKPERMLGAKSHRMARLADSSGPRLVTFPHLRTHGYFLLFFLIQGLTFEPAALEVVM